MTSRVLVVGGGIAGFGMVRTLLRREVPVQLLPKDAARRIPADAPSGCPS
jgi:cation diffusion facilitator CzcD-associated flavoprotein CzcO